MPNLITPYRKLLCYCFKCLVKKNKFPSSTKFLLNHFRDNFTKSLLLGLSLITNCILKLLERVENNVVGFKLFWYLSFVQLKLILFDFADGSCLDSLYV